MPFTPVKGRCRNCKKFFMRTKPTKVFCTPKCRDQYHNYGSTPQAQMEMRLRSFMRTEDFRALMRDTVRKTVGEVLAEMNQPPEGHPLHFVPAERAIKR